ncbi:MAG: chemotaxis protein CheC [Thermincola sp.]|jgi:chemotaxis protein CheC|nr:chemotaxis protein CheC [Thermincola sp.]MDT3701769.1 chemotaxis protein CheC [Thermincola sp.]
MQTFDHISEFQLDAFVEIGSIGAGNGATALSQLMERKIGMSVPAVKILPFAEVPYEVGGPEALVTGIFTSVEGHAPCNILFLFPIKSAKFLADKMLEADGYYEETIAEMGKSALAELANVVTGAYLNSLSSFTNLDFIPSVPALAIDMAGAILDTVLAQIGVAGDHALLLTTVFTETEENVAGHFFLLPAAGSLEKILCSIGVKV